MAFASRTYQKSYSVASQDWELLDSENESSRGQERLSVASLSSDESDTVIIFGGGKRTSNNPQSPIHPTLNQESIEV